MNKGLKNALLVTAAIVLPGGIALAAYFAFGYKKGDKVFGIIPTKASKAKAPTNPTPGASPVNTGTKRPPNDTTGGNIVISPANTPVTLSKGCNKNGGCTKDQVKQLQTRLNQEGYSLGIWGIDGDFGSTTETALVKATGKNSISLTDINNIGTNGSPANTTVTFGNVTTTDPNKIADILWANMENNIDLTSVKDRKLIGIAKQVNSQDWGNINSVFIKKYKDDIGVFYNLHVAGSIGANFYNWSNKSI